MPGRTLSWTVLGLGVVLALSAIAEFWVGLKAEHVSDLVRPEMTDRARTTPSPRTVHESVRPGIRNTSGRRSPAVGVCGSV